MKKARERTYMCIDLKSFYASVECVERGLDPMTTNLVVADPDRTEKTICLAVSPSLKALGVKNRCRVFQIPKGIEYIMATPRMQKYMDYSAEIYAIYLKYIAKEDIHVYSIDESFMDVTDYLKLYDMTAKELGQKIMQDIKTSLGITATCGIGSNLYLAKIALDITAKHVEDHIGILDEKKYQRTLWKHRPLTDFWRVGNGVAKRLEGYGIYTMEEIAKANEDILYKILGVDAELLIDHAWGRESTTIQDIKQYKPKSNSVSSGQVLPCDYSYEKGKIIVKEMAELLCLDLVENHLITASITLYVGYSNTIPMEPARGTTSLTSPGSSSRNIVAAVEQLYDRIIRKDVPIRRVNLSFNHVMDEACVQYDIFSTPEEIEKERNLQRAMIELKKKFGKNTILKGMNLEDGATTIERNHQIGGHRSGE